MDYTRAIGVAVGGGFIGGAIASLFTLNLYVVSFYGILGMGLGLMLSKAAQSR